MTSHSDDHLIDNHFAEHNAVVSASFEQLRPQILSTASLITHSLSIGRKLIAFGNGGSATQASHLVGELIGRFSKVPRRPLPAIALGADSGVVTCIGNDFGYDSLFWRQVEALAQPGDVVIGFPGRRSSAKPMGRRNRIRTGSQLKDLEKGTPTLWRSRTTLPIATIALMGCYGRP